MTRRAFLALLAAPLLAACFRSSGLRSALAGFFENRNSARSVGAAYLLAFPEEADEALLVQRLAGSPEREIEWERLAAADPRALHERVRERHRDDFAEGRCVHLRGWVLSETEARLCALAARSA